MELSFPSRRYSAWLLRGERQPRLVRGQEKRVIVGGLVAGACQEQQARAPKGRAVRSEDGSLVL